RLSNPICPVVLVGWCKKRMVFLLLSLTVFQHFCMVNRPATTRGRCCAGSDSLRIN
ncbi:uncharacterized protein METZ01_LOCUS506445, partial [marine metagenome]